MAGTADIRIGTAGWSIPRASAGRFDAEGTHLQRYARGLRCAEINSSFYRPHAAATYARWRDSTPPDFRFAVKIPRTITHVLKLVNAGEPFAAFLAPQVNTLLERYAISRVAADPSPVPAAAEPAGWPRLAYIRLHGSPRTCWSRYTPNDIVMLSQTIRRLPSAEEVWCVFDNTASSAAIENAWELREQLGRTPGAR